MIVGPRRGSHAQRIMNPVLSQIRWRPNKTQRPASVAAAFAAEHQSEPLDRLLSAFVGAVIGGGIAGALGVFVPLLVAPGANQGPMLGLFVTGPLGAVVGAVIGLVIPNRRGGPPPEAAP